MSGDVQPRKRKDKKKKRDDESSHGVHITKMGSDDVHLHVHEEHGTGGHWCAKLIFFSLMTILLGLVCLIILENRGISDMDTPLSESRFSNYFDGWVDEHRPEHDDHHGDEHGSLEDHDDHDDEHDEPFEEEADVSEGDEADEVDEDENVTQEEAEEADEDKDEDDQDDNDADDDNDDNVTAEDEDADDDNATAEDENVTAEDENVTAEEENVTAENDDAEEEEEEDDNATVEATTESAYEEAEDEEEDDNNTNEEDNVEDNATREASRAHSKADDDDEDDVFDEDEDDGTYDSVEKIVDNDAGELELLKEKARQQAAAEAKNNPASAENNENLNEDEAAEQASSWASSLTVKIGVGLALALVARLVLLKKDPITNDEVAPEVLMKRRLTIASPENDLPDDANEIEEPLPENDFSEEEIEIEEEFEIEEEIEYIDDIEEEPKAEENQVDAGNNMYVPETFEQLNAMYRAKGYQEEEDEEAYDDKRTQSRTEPEPYRTQYQTPVNTSTTTTTTTNNSLPKIATEDSFVNNTRKNLAYQSPNKPPVVFEVPPPPPMVEARIDVSNFSPTKTDFGKYSPPKADVTKYLPLTESVTKYSPPKEQISTAEEPKPSKREVTYDMDYQPEDDDIDYDEDDIYDDEEGHDDDSEELDDDELLDDDEEEEDISEVDDTELMTRLEAKYGKLPAKEFESDEDPDDPTWTQIKPKTGGGPQSYEGDNDLFEQELRRANKEMMREHYTTALQSFNQLIKKYPSKPAVYLGKARTLDRYAEHQESNLLLLETIETYKKYLDFKNYIKKDSQYRAAAERFLDRVRFLGQLQHALPIHRMLIDRFPTEPSVRNDLAVTFLILNRLSDAKLVLKETLQKWPQDGYALVQYGFVLKQLDRDYHRGSIFLRKGIESKAKGTQDGRFFLQLGEAYQRLDKQKEALDIYKRGVQLKLFLSVYQRSLYNEPNLKAQPFWTVEETMYQTFLWKLEQNWMAIKAEGLNVLSKSEYFLEEAESLKNKGDWKQFELYLRGQQSGKNCLKAPITCSLIEKFPAARECTRGQVKFSVMHAGTHVWPHCGPTNCRLRAHLGLVVPPGARIRVAEEERSWQEGKILIFDDSFEHEVWHEGHGLRLVLIVDIWHPDLTYKQRRSLHPI